VGVVGVQVRLRRPEPVTPRAADIGTYYICKVDFPGAVSSSSSSTGRTLFPLVGHARNIELTRRRRAGERVGDGRIRTRGLAFWGGDGEWGMDDGMDGG